MNTFHYCINNLFLAFSFNPFPEDRILPFSKLKLFADNNFIVAQTVQFFCDRVENIVGKGENAGCPHFLLFAQCFQEVSFTGSGNPKIVC